MDKKIKKIIKEEKGVVKDTQKLLKADKKMDAKMAHLEKVAAHKKSHNKPKKK